MGKVIPMLGLTPSSVGPNLARVNNTGEGGLMQSLCMLSLSNSNILYKHLDFVDVVFLLLSKKKTESILDHLHK